MKRILVITYYWPPSGGAGVQRWLKFTKYLREYGWEPVIYTPENPEMPERDESLLQDVPENLEILRTPVREPYSLYKFLLGKRKEERIQSSFLSEKKTNPLLQWISVWIRGNLFIPDARMLWIRPSVRFLKSYLQDHPVDHIVSTGPPHSMHLIARKLSGHFNIPWLADFRDPWTGIDFYRDLHLSWVADRIHHRMERRVLESATKVVVVGRTMAREFDRIVPRTYHVITNGFDEKDIPEEAAEVDSRFSLVHIGSMGPARNPVVLWDVLCKMSAELPGFKDDLLIRFIGKTDHTILASIEEQGLGEYLEKTDYLPHDEVVKEQRQAAVLLLIINNSPNARLILTGKFFEYMASGRPILGIGPSDGDAASILNETEAGKMADFGDHAALERYLTDFYLQFKKGTLTGRASGISRYSRKALTLELAGLLDIMD